MPDDSSTTTDSFELGAAEVCRILNRWSGRLEGYQTNRRNHPRHPMQTRMQAYIQDTTFGADDAAWKPVDIVSRNLSAGGIGLLAPNHLPAGKMIIRLAPDTLVIGDIVRQRKVHRGYWDVGVCFTSRLDPENTPEICTQDTPLE